MDKFLHLDIFARLEFYHGGDNIASIQIGSENCGLKHITYYRRTTNMLESFLI
jgi:hypothetical protein